MKYRAIGNTGLSVSEVGVGGWEIGGLSRGSSEAKGYGPADDETSLAALQAAYDAGCTFFDTADVYGYGHSECLIGQALKNWERDRIVIATKAGLDFSYDTSSYNVEPRPAFSETYLRKACEDSLQRLGVEAIDLYQLQNPSMALIQNGIIFNTLKTLQQEGKIRHYGISIHDPQEGIQAIQSGGVQAVQIAINLFNQRPLDLLFESCREKNVGIIAREPLAQGFLSGCFDPQETLHPKDIRVAWPKPLKTRRLQAAQTFQPLLNELTEAFPDLQPTYSLSTLALQYLLAFPQISSIIPGSKNPAHVTQNMAASDLPALDETWLAKIREIQKTLI